MTRPPIPVRPSPASISFIRPTYEDIQFLLLLWANSGCGKTTLAATAPGQKVIVQFDPGGHVSLANRDDFYLLDCSGSGAAATMAEFNAADPFGIKKFLQDHPEVETIVIDSITTLAFQALQYGVTKVANSTVEVPGRHGYGTRNNVMRRVVQVMMQLAGGLKRNLIVIAHESAPDEDTKEVSISLSKALANDTALKFNEVWLMTDTGDAREIHVRAHGRYTPMKSRMFQTNGANSFVWQYDADTKQGEGIADWIRAWQSNGGNKISLPTKGGVKK